MSYHLRIINLFFSPLKQLFYLYIVFDVSFRELRQNRVDLCNRLPRKDLTHPQINQRATLAYLHQSLQIADQRNVINCVLYQLYRRITTV